MKKDIKDKCRKKPCALPKKNEKLSEEDSKLLQRQLDYVYRPQEEKKPNPYCARPSKVTRNKNKRTITVCNAFDLNRIPVKVIAPYEKWIKFEEIFLKNNCSISLNTISTYISKPTKSTLQAIEKYYKEHPEDFAWHFYYHYILPSKDVNPLATIKKRGGSPYVKTRSEMVEIRRVSQWIYAFLSYWSKEPLRTYPTGLTGYIQNKGKILLPKKRKDIIALTKEVIKGRYNFEYCFTHECYLTDNFYRHYIAGKYLTRIKKALSSIQYQPTREPLSTIFC